MFDCRFEGKSARSLISICFPAARLMSIYSLARENDTVQVSVMGSFPAIGAVSILATHSTIQDLLYLHPDNSLRLFVGSLNELPLHLELPEANAAKGNVSGGGAMDQDPGDYSIGSIVDRGKMIDIQGAVLHRATIVTEGDDRWRISVDLNPKDDLTTRSLDCLACVLPERVYFNIFQLFLKHKAAAPSLDDSGTQEFDAFKAAVLEYCQIAPSKPLPPGPDADLFTSFLTSPAYATLTQDPVFACLGLPDPEPIIQSTVEEFPPPPPHHREVCKLLLSSLHLFCEDFKLSLINRAFVKTICPLLIQLAAVFRPEWLDYYARMCPDAVVSWNTSCSYGKASHSSSSIFLTQ